MNNEDLEQYFLCHPREGGDPADDIFIFQLNPYINLSNQDFFLQ